jgi:hypothetical protein
LGYGSWWGSSPLLDDDLLIYNGAMTATEVLALYNSYPQTGIGSPNTDIQVAYDAQANTIDISGLNGNGKVELVNLLGQKMRVANSALISTANLNKGIYLLNIQQGNYSRTQKIIIR